MYSINEINTDTIEGKYLLAALAKLTTESQRDKEPDEVLAQIRELSAHMFSEPTTNNNTEKHHV